MLDASVTATFRESIQLRPRPGTRCFGCSSNPCNDLLAATLVFSVRKTSCWCRPLPSSERKPRHRSVPAELRMAVHMSSIPVAQDACGGCGFGFIANWDDSDGSAEKLTDFFPIIGLLASHVSNLRLNELVISRESYPQDSGYLDKGYSRNDCSDITLQLPLWLKATVNTIVQGRKVHKLQGRGNTLADEEIVCMKPPATRTVDQMSLQPALVPQLSKAPRR